jgi:hypothetical protein
VPDTITSVSEFAIRLRRAPTSGFFGGETLKYDRTLKALFTASGVAADQCNLLYVKRHTFVASTAQLINLSAAVSDDGYTSNFFRVRFLAARVLSTTDGASLTLDNAGQASNPFLGFLNAAGTLKVFPSSANNDGFLILAAPNTAGALVGTGVNLRLLPSAHAFDADVIIAGGAS